MKSDSMVTCKEVNDAHPIRIKKIDKNLNLTGYCLRTSIWTSKTNAKACLFERSSSLYTKNKKF